MRERSCRQAWRWRRLSALRRSGRRASNEFGVRCRMEGFMKLMAANLLMVMASIGAMAQPISPPVEAKAPTVCAVQKYAREVGSGVSPVSYTHLRAHETGRNLVC